MKKTFLGLIVICILCLFLSSSAFAATIYACLTKAGSLTAVSMSPIPCSANQTPIYWNQTGPQGPVGPAGPAGVANGLSAAVHGRVNSDGTIQSGTGFTVQLDTSGVFFIYFTTPFTNSPDCIANQLETYALPAALGKCYVESADTYGIVVKCTKVNTNCIYGNDGTTCLYQVLPPDTLNNNFPFTTPQYFTFICVE